MLIVTHQINALCHFATRIVFLNGGKIAMDGTPDYVFRQADHPALNQFLRRVDFEDL